MIVALLRIVEHSDTVLAREVRAAAVAALRVYLEGPSRKNERYLARFSGFFQTQASGPNDSSHFIASTNNSRRT